MINEEQNRHEFLEDFVNNKREIIDKLNNQLKGIKNMYLIVVLEYIHAHKLARDANKVVNYASLKLLNRSSKDKEFISKLSDLEREKGTTGYFIETTYHVLYLDYVNLEINKTAFRVTFEGDYKISINGADLKTVHGQKTNAKKRTGEIEIKLEELVDANSGVYLIGGFSAYHKLVQNEFIPKGIVGKE